MNEQPFLSLKDQLHRALDELSAEQYKSGRLARTNDELTSRISESELALECEHDRGKRLFLQVERHKIETKRLFLEAEEHKIETFRLKRKCARLESALASMAVRLVESD